MHGITKILLIQYRKIDTHVYFIHPMSTPQVPYASFCEARVSIFRLTGRSRVEGWSLTNDKEQVVEKANSISLFQE